MNRQRLTGLAALAVSIAVVACSESDQVVFTADVVGPATTSVATTEAVVVPTATLPPTTPTTAIAAPPPTAAPAPIVVERLWSPANATAEMVGTGALPTDPVTVDGAPANVVSFDRAEEGTFTLRVWIEDEGAHTVCVRDECGRVYTLAPDAETIEEVEAKIDEAIPLAQQIVDFEALYPEWTIEVSGPFSGVGGSTDPDRLVVTVHANRGRTVDDYVRTILHEYGHVADFERLTDEERLEYLAVRGIPADVPWRSDGTHSLEEWAQQPAEDFAEVVVALWTDGELVPRTAALAPAPDQATLDAVAGMLAD